MQHTSKYSDNDDHQGTGVSSDDFREIVSSLYVTSGCMLYNSRVFVPRSLQHQVLQLLHFGHFGI